jgi:hypothetical protein
VVLSDDATMLRTLRLVGYPAEVGEGWREFPVDTSILLTDLARAGALVAIPLIMGDRGRSSSGGCARRDRDVLLVSWPAIGPRGRPARAPRWPPLKTIGLARGQLRQMGVERVEGFVARAGPPRSWVRCRGHRGCGRRGRPSRL